MFKLELLFLLSDYVLHKRKSVCAFADHKGGSYDGLYSLKACANECRERPTTHFIFGKCDVGRGDNCQCKCEEFENKRNDQCNKTTVNEDFDLYVFKKGRFLDYFNSDNSTENFIH